MFIVPPFSSLWPCFAGAYDGLSFAGQHAGRVLNQQPVTQQAGIQSPDGHFLNQPRTAAWVQQGAIRREGRSQ